MTKTASEIYCRALERLGPFPEGQFNVLHPFSGKLRGDLVISKIAADPSDLKPLSELAPTVQILFSPLGRREVRYTFYPGALSIIPREEIDEIDKIDRMPSFFRTLFSGLPRVVANSRELERLLETVNGARETTNFKRKLEQYEQWARQRASEERARQRAEEARQLEERAMEVALAKARPILEKVRGVEGPKFLGLVFDDNIMKRVSLLDQYDAVKDQLDFKAVVEWIGHDEEAIRLVTTIQRLNVGQSQVPVVVFMDGRFPRESKFKEGLDAACALEKELDELGLPMPFLVGNSNSPYFNTLLEIRFPKSYLATSGGATSSIRQTWNLIGARIKPESTQPNI